MEKVSHLCSQIRRGIWRHRALGIGPLQRIRARTSGGDDGQDADGIFLKVVNVEFQFELALSKQ